MLCQGTQLLMSPAITVQKSTLKGNIVLVANQLSVVSESLLATQNGGCSFFGGIPGTPSLFVSHSFSCGLNAGSYGGRGGVGIAENQMDTLECIKNGYARMSVYGSPLSAVASGATGSPYTIQDKAGSSPGAISIIVNSFTLDKDSKVQAGYSEEYKSSPASSGGSASIIAYNLTVLGKISANGQSSDKDMAGEGGGGRISFYKVCWFENNESTFNFTMNSFEALAGKRPDFNSSFKSTVAPYLDYIYAQNGSKLFSNFSCHIHTLQTGICRH